MEWLNIIGVLAIGVTVSYIAMRLWIAFWDSLGGGIKKILGIGRKKETINWHTANNETIKKDGVPSSTSTTITQDESMQHHFDA